MGMSRTDTIDDREVLEGVWKLYQRGADMLMRGWDNHRAVFTRGLAVVLSWVLLEAFVAPTPTDPYGYAALAVGLLSVFVYLGYPRVMRDYADPSYLREDYPRIAEGKELEVYLQWASDAHEAVRLQRILNLSESIRVRWLAALLGVSLLVQLLA